MKKRMLITTIAMVLVVAVALTTSSLAWFTMSSQVQTTDVTFAAAQATGADLVFANLNVYNIDQYGSSIAFASDAGTMYPATGKVTMDKFLKETIVGEGTTYSFDTGTGTGGQYLNLATSALQIAADVKNKTGSTGRTIADQLVKLTNNSGSNANFYAAGFNVKNTFGTAITTIVVNGTLTVSPVTRTVATGAADGLSLLKGYVAYNGSAYVNYGATAMDETAAAAAKYYQVNDLALLGSLRIAMFHDNSIGDGSTLNTKVTTDDIAKNIYGFTGIKLGNSNNNYTITTGGSSNNYYVETPDAAKYYATEDGVVSADGESTAEALGETSYGAITNMSFDAATGKATFAFEIPGTTGNEALLANGTSSIIFLLWMDGWDTECLPAAATGNMTIGFTVGGSI